MNQQSHNKIHKAYSFLWALITLFLMFRWSSVKAAMKNLYVSVKKRIKDWLNEPVDNPLYTTSSSHHDSTVPVWETSYIALESTNQATTDTPPEASTIGAGKPGVVVGKRTRRSKKE